MRAKSRLSLSLLFYFDILTLERHWRNRIHKYECPQIPYVNDMLLNLVIFFSSALFAGQYIFFLLKWFTLIQRQNVSLRPTRVSINTIDTTNLVDTVSWKRLAHSARNNGQERTSLFFSSDCVLSKLTMQTHTPYYVKFLIPQNFRSAFI